MTLYTNPPVHIMQIHIELPCQPSMTPIESPAASQVEARPRRDKHTFDRAKKSTPLANALSKLISDVAGNADALFNLVDRTG